MKYCYHYSYILVLFLFFSLITSSQAEEKPKASNSPLVLLVPSQQAVISAKVETSIKTYKATEGGEVKKGELVVELDKEPFELQKNVLTARLAETRVQEKHWGAEFTRFKKLYDKSAVPETKLEEMRFRKDQTAERLENLESMIKVVELDIRYCNIKAPFNGRIVKKIAQRHEFLEIGDPIFKIINDSILHAIVHFKSALINDVKVGQMLRVKIQETSQTYLCKIVKVSADIDPESRTFKVVAELHNKSGKLKSGMFGLCLGVEKAKMKNKLNKVSLLR